MIFRKKQSFTDVTGRQFSDELTKFLHWWLKNGPTLPQVPVVCGHSFTEAAAGLVLYRKGQFQVQLFVVSPNFSIPEHRHPNVDSYEIYLSGMQLTHNSKMLIDHPVAKRKNVNGTSIFRGATIRVKPNDLHGGHSSPNGGSFVSVQQWLNGISPSAVEKDWDGPEMGTKHALFVKKGV